MLPLPYGLRIRMIGSAPSSRDRYRSARSVIPSGMGTSMSRRTLSERLFAGGRCASTSTARAATLIAAKPSRRGSVDAGDDVEPDIDRVAELIAHHHDI